MDTTPELTCSHSRLPRWCARQRVPLVTREVDGEAWKGGEVSCSRLSPFTIKVIADSTCAPYGARASSASGLPNSFHQLHSHCPEGVRLGCSLLWALNLETFSTDRDLTDWVYPAGEHNHTSVGERLSCLPTNRTPTKDQNPLSCFIAVNP